MTTARHLDSAEEWLAYLLSHQATGEDLRQLEAWLEENPQHRSEFEILQRGWQLAGDLEGDPDLRLEAAPLSQASQSHAWRQGLLAATALAMVILSLFWFTRGPDRILQHRTAPGEQRTVDLRDGSRAHLNTATQLKVAANGHDVELLEGEVFFEVRTRRSGVFSVDAGVGEVKVLGTRFNVLREDDHLLISVLEGRVAVEPKVRTEETVYSLSVGQTLEIRGAQKPRLLTDGSDQARVKAWQEGKVEFKRTPLLEAIQELSRYTPESFRLTEPSLGTLPVSGVFRIERLGDPDSVRFALENTLPVTIRSTGDALEVIPADG